jgi:GT2 family glycosyltransferase
VRDVDWARSAALLVRREAAARVGWLTPDEVGFCRRLHEAGWSVLYVPGARAVAHDGGERQSGGDRRLLARLRGFVGSRG